MLDNLVGVEARPGLQEDNRVNDVLRLTPLDGVTGNCGVPDAKSNQPSLHNRLIANICAAFPAVRTRGFMKALGACGDYMADILRNNPDWVSSVRVVPDVYVINHEAREVTVWEVVDTHDLTAEKMSRYEEIGWALDQDYYVIGVIRADRHGARWCDPVATSASLGSTPLASVLS